MLLGIEFHLNRMMVVSGFAVTLLMGLLSIFRGKRTRMSTLSACVIWYLAGSNIPVALWLCSYAINPDPALAATKLHGYERYVGLAGVCFLLVTLTTLLAPLRRNRSPNPGRETTRRRLARNPAHSKLAIGPAIKNKRNALERT